MGIEARGFILAAPVAYRLGAGLRPRAQARQAALRRSSGSEYELEYGDDLLEIHLDALQPGERCLVVDDVLATGGTAAATGRLVERLGGEVVGFAFLIELGFLKGRESSTTTK